MNDPGLDEPIGDASAIVKENIEENPPADHGNAQSRPNPRTSHPSNSGSTTSAKSAQGGMSEEEEERSFQLPARWWYASTGIPLVAGTFGPMANAFSICALVENWRVSIPPGGTEEHGDDIKDPPWLIAINAISLVCALVANTSLLLNMARRVSFRIAQPITILGFWVASVLLIALIAIASHNFHKAGVNDQALTQAYYYAIFAAGLYQIISYLMCVTVYGAYRGHYSKEFKLTVPQRTLMLQTISFLAYLLLGALVYSHIEGWKFLDAVYWADFTSLTIGIGADYVPKTHLGRGLLFPFAMGGIIILGLLVGSIRSLILERGKKKMAARLTEKARRRLVKEIDETSRKKSRLGRKGVMGLKKDTVTALTAEPGSEGISELDRRQAEFEAMRRVQARSASEKKYMSLAVSSVAFAFLWFLGALIFSHAEQNQQWSYFESLYFSYTTLLTIGYGDFQPISNSGKPFFVFWSLLAIPTLTILISDMGDTVVKAVKDATIWLGEVTVLPSDQDTISNRLKHGLYRATFGQVDTRRNVVQDVENGNEDDDDSSVHELHPGLAKIFHNGFRKSRRHRHRHRDDAGDKVAADYENREEIEEEEAEERGDRWEEDQHHYRHILMSQIRRVYADTSAATPKKYSYEEWRDFLKLLGEDEQDPFYHKRVQAGGAKDGGEAEDDGQDVVDSPQTKDTIPKEKEDSQVTKWSWIGNRSPLMGDQEEAEWLLERLFQRLHDSLRVEMEKTRERGRNEDDEGRQRRRNTQSSDVRSGRTASKD